VTIEIKVPSLGESESEATLAHWLKQQGDPVEVDDVLAEIESDKITMEITALDAGILKELRKQAGDTVTPGEVIGIVEEGPAEAKITPPVTEKREKPVPEEAPPSRPEIVSMSEPDQQSTVMEEEEISPPQGHLEERVPMSRLRKRIAERLKQAQNTAAILTTFNEVDMQEVMGLRGKFREAFKARHGVDLGLMSFFTLACTQALRTYPVINACIEDDDVIYRNYFNIGIAVASDRGLVVPVLRDAGGMDMAAIERGIASLAGKARNGGLTPDDLKGGTFSITNGGVFGSLLSTPILNPPQSAILGMHRIVKRPVVVNDQIAIRPMMYLALSYDHRLIDGKDAVLFLNTIKEFLEYPARNLLDL